MKKKKSILIVVLILIILLIGGAFAFLYFFTDLFSSTQDLFWKYFAQNDDIFTIIENDKYDVQSQFKQSNSYTSTGNLAVVIEQGESSSTQLNVETTSRHDATSGRTYADATLKNGDIDLFQVSYINSDDIYAIRCEEIFQNYVGIRNSGLTELATNYGIETSSNIPDSINLEDYSGLLNITDEQKQHISDTYLPIILNYILDTQYSKSSEEIEINGVSYDTNVYSLQLTGESAKQIIVDCLNAVKSDTETLVLISNKLSILGLGIEYTDTSNLSLRIDELISQIQQMSMEDAIYISVYESDEVTVRTKIQIENVIEITYDRAGGNFTLTCDIYQTNTSITNELEDTNTLSSANYINSSVSTNVNEESVSDSTTVGNDIEVTENTIDNNVTIEENQITNDVIEGNETQTSEDITDATDMTDGDEALDIESQLTTNIIISRIIISKTTTDNLTTNNIQIIPNLDNYNENINVTYSLSAVQNNSINNSYSIIVNDVDDYSTEVTTITYNTNIVAASQVEEIEELTSSNTAIANNYSAEEFSTFMTSWSTLFLQTLTGKLSVIGFEI